jgi:signal transduction histidine kinase/ligand-binding sensor domain-containing protein/DNA-binding response OmpR family regulator
MKGYYKISCLILLMIFPFVLSYPQSDQIKFRHLTEKQGLPHYTVNDITKGPDGYMWFATAAGLCRYDGYNIKIYQNDPDDSTTISSNNIRCLLVDDNNILWIGTAYGLNKMDLTTEKFTWFKRDSTNPNSLSHNFINTIYKDSAGMLWIGTKYGLNEMNVKDGLFRSYFQKFGNKLSDVDNIQSINKDHFGKLWIGTWNGLFHFDRENKSFGPVDLISSSSMITECLIVRCIHIDNKDILWLNTGIGLFKYEQESDRITHYRTTTLRYSIIEDPFEGDRYLWIPTAKGLFTFDKLTGNFVRIKKNSDDPLSLSSNGLTKMYLDENANLWIGTFFSGIDILNLNENRFTRFDISPSQQSNWKLSATAFYKDQNDYLWVGTIQWGLQKFDPEMNLVKSYSGFEVDDVIYTQRYVFVIYEDSKNNLWVGCSGAGLNLLDRQKDDFIHCKFFNSGSHPLPVVVYDIIEDRYGTIWAGTRKGLYKQDNDRHLTANFYNVDHDLLKDESIFSFCEDRKDNIWISTISSGLFCLTQGSKDSLFFTQYKHDPDNPQSINSNMVYSIYEDNTRAIWVGTNRGLNKLLIGENKFVHFEDNIKRFTKTLYDFTGDKNGNLWLTTSKGLIRYDPEADFDKRVKLFTTSDGLPFENIYPNKIYKNNKGDLYVGGRQQSGDGFFYFSPEDIKDNRSIPPVVLTNFKVRNEPFLPDSNITYQKHIHLKYNENFFSFEFAALDYIDSDKNQYAYYLEGLEDDWIYCGYRRAANYTNVPPGNYVFRVKGSNNDGYWNEEGTSINITILSPPWKTWWAYTIYGIFLIGLFYSWRRYDLKRQRLKQELELEQVQSEKLEELDKMKSRFFANISHEFRTPITLILGPLEKLRSKIVDQDSEQDLNIMQRNALRLQKLINQLLNLSKLESGKMKLQVKEENIVALVNGYTQSFESLAKQKKIDLNFKSSEENIPLFVDKDKIEKILYNLLSNAFKFTGEGGFIEVAVCSRQFAKNSRQYAVGKKDIEQIANCQLPTANFAGPWAEIKVSDTGRGIPPEKLEHIFDRFYQADDSYTKDQEGTGIGLALTKELVEIHHGKISVESEVMKGTTFYVFLPKGKKHLKADEIVEKTTITEKREEFSEPIPELEFLENHLTPSGHQNQDEIEVKDDKPFLLIVDDNADLRTYIRGYLDPLYNISEAMDGTEGFNKATEKIPDLIISDVMMPKRDGYELCEKLKTDERTSHIPVILLTARASTESKIEGLETGADDFITKPFDHQELLIRIKNLIQQRNKLKDKFRKEIDYNKHSKDRNILSMDQQFIRKAKLVVENNISEPDLNVENFAREMALSRVQLHRKLKALVDQSATQFVRTIRLNRAAELLTKHSGTVSEIAYDVGFNTLPYFTKCFQEQFGVNPSEFNNQDRKS